MDITKRVAKFRLAYHLNMIDLCNVAYQLHLISGEEADSTNKNHLKKCLDCYKRLGYKLPKVFEEFMNEKD